MCVHLSCKSSSVLCECVLCVGMLRLLHVVCVVHHNIVCFVRTCVYNIMCLHVLYILCIVCGSIVCVVRI